LLFDKECKGVISREEVMAVVAENGQKDFSSMSVLSQVKTSHASVAGGAILPRESVRGTQTFDSRFLHQCHSAAHFGGRHGG